ncbi:hypothetical protein [Pantoea sp. NGS-ED-1003]|uniref:hypothetical protein n=1 Tax=Pantoea sp. NGS-ED-1003 TaxID=1526743 RepID=UPI000A95564F|nr:hypothetical protein [Pantoea sp. NGS-ED-1003]
MSDKNELERQKFERWARSAGMDTYRHLDDEERYERISTQFHWQCWLARSKQEEA